MLVNHPEAQQEILDLLLGLRKAGVAFNSVSVRSVIQGCSQGSSAQAQKGGEIMQISNMQVQVGQRAWA